MWGRKSSFFLKKCKCGEVFSTKKRTKKPFNEGHERLKDFISRNLPKKLSGKEMAREIRVAKLMLKICATKTMTFYQSLQYLAG